MFEVLLGIQLVNDFEINPFQSNDQDYGYEKKQGPSIRGLFALASMPSHNCVANSTHDFASRYLLSKLKSLLLWTVRIEAIDDIIDSIHLCLY